MNPKEFDLENMVRDDMYLLNEQISDDIWKHADLLIKKAKGDFIQNNNFIVFLYFRKGMCYNVSRNNFVETLILF